MPEQQILLPEVGRDVSFVMKLLDFDPAGATAGVLTPAAARQDQPLSRSVDETGTQLEWGRLAEVDLMLRMEEADIRAADAVYANWVDICLDWELGLLGIRRLGQILPVGGNDIWPNPLSEVFFEYLQNAWGNPLQPQRRVQIVMQTFDRIGTWTGKISGNTWRYRRAENNDNLVIKCVDIGTPNPSWEMIS